MNTYEAILSGLACGIILALFIIAGLYGMAGHGPV
jgi:hypothetical protein